MPIAVDLSAIPQEDAAWSEQIVTCGMPCGKYNSLNLAKKCIDEGIEGDFVECGVNAGGHPAIMAYVSRKYDQGRRKTHLFDSFEGLPQAGPDDTQFDKDILGVNEDRNKGIKANRLIAELWQVELNMTRWGIDPSLLVYHKGWLQEVLPLLPPMKIALLRVDVDLHDSTIPVFEYLYPMISSGGWIISDDWGETENPIPARLATLKYFEKMGLPAPTVRRMIETPGTVCWQKP